MYDNPVTVSEKNNANQLKNLTDSLTKLPKG